MKKLFVDGQVFQTGALERGMGILTLELLRAILRQSSDFDIVVILNNRISTSPHHDARMDVLLSGLKTVHIDLDTPATGSSADAHRQIDAYLEGQISQDDAAFFFEPSLFLFDYHALVPTRCTSIVFFHDLIPLVMWENLKNVFPGNVYFERFPLIDAADIVLANSQNTRSELISLLGVNGEKIFCANFSGETFDLDIDASRSIIAKLGVKKKYLLLPTGGGYMAHKNNTVALQSVGLAARNSDLDVTIVATSRYEEFEKQKLLAYYPDILFTGSVEHETMQALYMNAHGILMPSLAEGLGIPLLNGVKLNKPVICSDIPVFSEISGGNDVFYAFKAHDPRSGASAILEALAGYRWKEKKAGYGSINGAYTWDKTGEQFITMLSAIPQRQGGKEASAAMTIISPDPLSEKGVGYRAQAAAVTLRRTTNVDFFIDGGVDPVGYDDRGADFVRALVKTYDLTDFAKYHGRHETTVVFVTDNENFPLLNVAARGLGNCIIYIRSIPTRRSYDALLAKGFISKTMHEYETSHADEDEAMLGALLRSAKAVVAENHIQATVERSLKRMKSDIPCLFVTQGSSDLGLYVNGDDAEANERICRFIKENA